MSQPPITIAQARELVLRTARALPSEQVAISEALDRVLASDLVAAGDVPAFPCSAMDGYAIRAGPAERGLRLVGESRAGAPSERALEHGEAIRISTGGAVPAGATAVIPQEDAERRDGIVFTKVAVAAGDNVRQPGDDIRSGTTVLEAGTTLGAAALGAAVAAGAGELTVARRPRLHVLCTGDELRAQGEPLGPGQIHNSNAPMLAALALRCGATVLATERIRDDHAATESGLARALAGADLVVVAGGVSVGPHDHVKPALASLGVQEVFWGVALQPGKPTWFGVRGRTLVFGLPGNPVSAAVTFSLFVAPALAAMQARRERAGDEREATLGEPVARNPTREQALRVRLERRHGMLVAIPNGPQGSHIVSSLLGADALALIPAGDGELAAGAKVSLEQLPR